MGLFFKRLLQACADGDVDAARRRLKRGLDVNAHGGEYGWTPLATASSSNQFEMVKFLLDEASADINAKNKNGFTALFYARNSEMASLLTSRGANRGNIGQTALREAASFSRADLVATHNDPGLPMENVVQRIASDADSLGDGLFVLQALVYHGAKWDLKYGTSIHTFSNPGDEERWRHVGAALSFAVDLWTEERQQGLPLTDIPEQKIVEGLVATHTFVKDRAAALPFERLLKACEEGDVDAARQLLEKGLDVDARGGTLGQTPLIVASLFSQIDMVLFLVDEAGADVNATNEDGKNALHYARTSRMANLLLLSGANVDTRDKFDDLPIRLAIHRIASDAASELGVGIQLLRDLVRLGVKRDLEYEPSIRSTVRRENVQRWRRVGAALYFAVDLWTEEEQQRVALTNIPAEEIEKGVEATEIYVNTHTMGFFFQRLLQTCMAGDIDATRRLLERGLDVNSSGWRNHERTPLVGASQLNHVEMARLLLDEAGADANATSKDGYTALQRARTSEMASLLLSRGASVDARDKDGRTALHHASYLLLPGVVRVLLGANADVSIANSGGKLPMDAALWRMAYSESQLGDGLSVLQDFVRHGAKWDPTYNRSISRSFGGEANLRWQRIALALRYAVDLWTEEQQHGLPLTHIPEEEIEKGLEATQIYVEARKTSKLIVCRRTICVVGPSTVGKTSLIKSLIKEDVCLEKIEDRTIGIDHFTLKFDEPTPRPTQTSLAMQVQSPVRARRTHEVKFSDFAGQNVYQVMHSLFFTRRTLFMICIDLNVYSIMMLRCEMLTPNESRMQHLMNEYVDGIVLTWIRMILARQCDAEFVFVCTKEDTVSSGPGVDKEEVLAHVKMMLGRVMVVVQGLKEAAQYDQNRRIEKSAEHTPKQITHLWDPRLPKARKPSVCIIVADSSTTTSVQDVRSQLEKLVIESGRSYETPEKYIAVLRYLIGKRKPPTDEMEKAFQVPNQTQATFVDVDELVTELQLEVPSLEDAEVAKNILRTLRDCSDILWYEDVADAKLQTTVMLDPKMLIDYLRQVINHKHARSVIYHAILCELTYWRELNDDPEAMLAMKRLLQTFQLVHPAEGEMAWDSDLIVPTFWKTNPAAVWVFGGEKLRLNARGMDVETVARRVHWEFRFTHFIPETLFDHLVVAAYSPLQRLDVGPDWLLYRDGQLAACRVMLSRNWKTHERSLLLEAVLAVDPSAAGKSEKVLWSTFQGMCDALASVLKEHPGLTVTKFAHTDKKDHRPSLSSIARMIEKDKMEDKTWMPPPAIADTCVRVLSGARADISSYSRR